MIDAVIKKRANILLLVANLATDVCGLQVMACGQSDLLHTSARGAKNTCRKPGWIWLGGVPSLTSIGLSHDGQDATG